MDWFGLPLDGRGGDGPLPWTRMGCMDGTLRVSMWHQDSMVFVRRQIRWGWRPLLSGAEMPGARAVLVPRRQMEAVGRLSWQQCRSMVLHVCHCSTKPPWRGRGCHQPFPVGQTGTDAPCPGAPSTKGCKNRGRRAARCEAGAKRRARETKEPLGRGQISQMR